MSDSDSDFETPPHPRRPSFRESNEISPVLMETSLKASMREIEKVQQLKTDVSVLSAEVKRTESTLYSFKKALSCIVCKALATFPWKVTPCCRIIMCSGCVNRWLSIESSCPHCRASVESDSCQTVERIPSIGALISSDD